MYCKNCGAQISDDAKFCPKCAAPQDEGGGFNPIDVIDPNKARTYLTRGSVGVAAVVLAVVAIVFFLRLVGTIEDVITSFSSYDTLSSALGIAGFVVCGGLLTGCAVFAAMPVVRFVLDEYGAGRAAIDRSILFSIVLLLLCVATWICKLIFHSPVGGDVSGVLYTIFSTYGETASACLVPVIIAAVILYVVRTKLLTTPAYRY